MKQLLAKKVFIWLLLTLNSLFAFIIGLTIPLLKSQNHYNLGLVMIPLLILLNYIIIDRFHYYLKNSMNKGENSDG